MDKESQSEQGIDSSVPIDKQEYSAQEKHLENASENSNNDNLVYNDDEIEPEIHARTWIALASLWLLNYVQVVALQGPPAVVRSN